ncbi:hypothetical protein PG985_009787 [Apiospora marii]|uniref:uncharacterized protein n=1 Tax=Apiospora marii TaxID=335849 RepID=UPI0031302064
MGPVRRPQGYPYKEEAIILNTNTNTSSSSSSSSINSSNISNINSFSSISSISTTSTSMNSMNSTSSTSSTSTNMRIIICYRSITNKTHVPNNKTSKTTRTKGGIVRKKMPTMPPQVMCTRWLHRTRRTTDRNPLRRRRRSRERQG